MECPRGILMIARHQVWPSFLSSEDIHMMLLTPNAQVRFTRLKHCHACALKLWMLAGSRRRIAAQQRFVPILFMQPNTNGTALGLTTSSLGSEPEHSSGLTTLAEHTSHSDIESQSSGLAHLSIDGEQLCLMAVIQILSSLPCCLQLACLLPLAFLCGKQKVHGSQARTSCNNIQSACDEQEILCARG